jgi:ubiquinone/menaquinone biosynthesis C-methylase UbiE
MGDTIIQKHWYDGWFYAFFIDAKFYDFRDRLFRFVGLESHALDIGCGTGAFAMKLARHCAHVTGVDISGKQIKMAKKRLARSKIQNVNFIHADASSLPEMLDRKYDAAFFSFVIHEMSHENRIKILKSVSHVATQLIILEYNTPHPMSLYGLSTRLIEFFAGGEHYANFKDFLNRKGMDGILSDANLTTHAQWINRKKIFRTDLINTE